MSGFLAVKVESKNAFGDIRTSALQFPKLRGYLKLLIILLSTTGKVYLPGVKNTWLVVNRYDTEVLRDTLDQRQYSTVQYSSRSCLTLYTYIVHCKSITQHLLWSTLPLVGSWSLSSAPLYSYILSSLPFVFVLGVRNINTFTLDTLVFSFLFLQMFTFLWISGFLGCLHIERSL